MIKKILSTLLSIAVIAALLVGCGSRNVDNTDAQTESVVATTADVSKQPIDNSHNDNSANVLTEKSVDYETLGIKKYEYPSEFSMGDNLKTAITQLALSVENFNKDSVSSGNWKEIFIARFIQDSRVSFDYLNMISDKNNGQISTDELNYIQYSLTNTELDFSSYA
ncbi:MAG: hypothetical protein PUI46_11395, partial [Lachnospiraceae bacterium]|nr:hypothetical protein [Lachnospiraceae bacterium]